MNKLIIGLSCLSVLSITSCDNETSDKPDLPLEKVNFSAASGLSSSNITFADGDKVTLYIKDGNDAAKYYTDSDRNQGTTFPTDGQEFTLDANGSIKGGFYLKSSADPGNSYTLTQFDINQKYVLKEDLTFKVITGQTNSVSVVIVDKKEATVAGRVSNLVDIPDDNFRAYLKKKIPNAFYGDKMDSYSLDVQNLLVIDVHNQRIKNLKGIEYFTGLEILYCYQNQLTSLDVTHNTDLTGVSCWRNELTSLDVTKNTDLILLECGENKLTSLDVTHNTALTLLVCYDNQLTSLDVTHNTALTKLGCSYNQLTSLDVTHNTALDYLSCWNNQLTSLDVTKNTDLTTLGCMYNQLTSLDVTHNTALTKLNCYKNQLTSLDVTHNTALTLLYCWKNQLTSLDVTHNTDLTELYCWKNQLTSLDVTQNTDLTELGCAINKLTSLDVTHNTALTKLSCYTNQLTSLDLTHNCNLNSGNVRADRGVTITYCK